MANKTNQPQKQAGSKPQKEVKIAVKADFADKLDNYFTNNSRIYLFLILIVSTLFSALLFDVKPGIGGDDSSYVIRAFDFVTDGTYPGYQGPMYPFILAPFVALFGIKLPLLKILSLIFIVCSVFFTYKAFEKKVPQSILILSLLLISINYNLLYFASQTYSEAWFIFIQSIFLLVMSRTFFTEISPDELPIKKFIVPALILFVMALSRSIAYVAVAATIGYFLVTKQWKSALKITAGFILFYVAFEIIKRLIWGYNSVQFASQGSSLMLKDFYNPALGNEDLPGFINRLIGNSNLYFSKHLFNFMGLRIDNIQTNTALTIIVWGLIINALYWAFKQNKWMLLNTIYIIGMCIGTFLALQVKWDQWRMLIVLFPIMLISIFLGIYYPLKNKKYAFLQFIPILLAVVIFFNSLAVTVNKSKVQSDILSKNLKGNMLYGFTPDWINYILMSQWVAKNTPKDQLTAVRKADISALYGSRKFYPINKVPSLELDSFLKLLPDTTQYPGIYIDEKTYPYISSNKELQSKLIGLVSGKLAFKTLPVSDGTVVAVLHMNKSDLAKWEPEFNKLGFIYETNCKEWLKTFTSDYAIYIPEMLLENLKASKVKYMLLANLRANPNQYTGNIINTLHRFVYFTQIKYPDIYTVVHTIGEEEYAQLIEIKY